MTTAQVRAIRVRHPVHCTVSEGYAMSYPRITLTVAVWRVEYRNIEVT